MSPTAGAGQRLSCHQSAGSPEEGLEQLLAGAPVNGAGRPASLSPQRTPWRAWSDDELAQAREEGVPPLLCSAAGAAACWPLRPEPSASGWGGCWCSSQAPPAERTGTNARPPSPGCAPGCRRALQQAIMKGGGCCSGGGAGGRGQRQAQLGGPLLRVPDRHVRAAAERCRGGHRCAPGRGLAARAAGGCTLRGVPGALPVRGACSACPACPSAAGCCLGLAAWDSEVAPAQRIRRWRRWRHLDDSQSST